MNWVGHFNLPIDANMEEEDEIGDLLEKNNCVPVYLEEGVYSKCLYYYTNVLHRFFHNFVCPDDNFEFIKYEYWEAYNIDNKRVAETIIEQYESNALIWINDTYLLMCPFQIIRKNMNANIGLYIHSSFPSCEIFRIFPYREEMLVSMLSCNIVGFHVFGYARNFLIACRRILGISHKASYVFY